MRPAFAPALAGALQVRIEVLRRRPPLRQDHAISLDRVGGHDVLNAPLLGAGRHHAGDALGEEGVTISRRDPEYSLHDDHTGLSTPLGENRAPRPPAMTR